MKKDDLISEIRATKDILISDLRCAITFKPDRTHDLYRFMEAYLGEAEQDNREEVKERILGHLVNCAQGREYPDPMEGQYLFTNDDVDHLEQRLDSLLQSVEHGDHAAFDAIDAEISAVQSDAASGMMDTWRREMIQVLRTTSRDLLGPTVQTPNTGPRMEMGW